MGLVKSVANVVDEPTYSASSSDQGSSPEDGHLDIDEDTSVKTWHPETNSAGEYLEVITRISVSRVKCLLYSKLNSVVVYEHRSTSKKLSLYKKFSSVVTSATTATSRRWQSTPARTASSG